MKRQIEYKGLQPTEHLEAQIDKEIEKLEKKFDWVNNMIIHLVRRKELETGCEVEIIARGKIAPEIFVKEQNGKFEVAIAKAFDVLDRQLRRRKEKVMG